MRYLSAVVALLLGIASSAFAEPPVPAAFADLYVELVQGLDEAEQTLDATCGPETDAVVFGAELLPANSNRGDIGPSRFWYLRLLLDRFESLGIEAVTITVSYPYLLPEYHSSVEQAEAALAPYRRLAGEARNRGLKVIVKTHAMFPSLDPGLALFYSGLTLEEYTQGRLEVARIILRELRPDYLSVQAEPDTEAFATGLPVNTLENGIELVRVVTDGLASETGAEATAFGAGVGTWQQNYREYVDALVALPALDFVDLHLYPIGRDYFVRALEIADTAAAAGRQVGVSEAWLYKIRDRELVLASVLAGQMLGRDTYDFWEPLDQRYLGVTGRLARCRQFAFLSPSRSDQFFVYLDYDRVRAQGVARQLILSTTGATFRAINGLTTGTGETYGRIAAGAGTP
jgi:hypothetical protein